VNADVVDGNTEDNDRQQPLSMSSSPRAWTQKKTVTKWSQPPERQSWTYKLYEQAVALIAAGDKQELPAYIRGPYGSAYGSCFEPKYTAAIVIGAGTGLTSALSALRDMVRRNLSEQARPRLMWFVWGCARVEDLEWCWGELFSLLCQAQASGAINRGHTEGEVS
jgi:hypothetical protein